MALEVLASGHNVKHGLEVDGFHREMLAQVGKDLLLLLRLPAIFKESCYTDILKSICSAVPIGVYTISFSKFELLVEFPWTILIWK